MFVPQLKIQAAPRAPRFSMSLCRCLHFMGKAEHVKYCAVTATGWESSVVSSRRWHCVLSGLKIIYMASKCTSRTNEILRGFVLFLVTKHTFHCRPRFIFNWPQYGLSSFQFCSWGLFKCRCVFGIIYTVPCVLTLPAQRISVIRAL